MAHENSKITGFAIDSNGTLTNISGSVTSITPSGGTVLLDDTGLGDTQETVIAGLGGPVTVSVAGMLNSTTRGIFAPLVEHTSVTVTVEYKLATGEYWYGEAYAENVQLGIQVGQINTFSADMRAQAGLTQTSVTQVS